jgi:acetoin utilization deacetylase AcuC-like enzyme
VGFDTYVRDPVGDFALTSGVYHEVGRRAAATGKRPVILQEGGYDLPALGDNARAWLHRAEGRASDPQPAPGWTDVGTRG